MADTTTDRVQLARKLATVKHSVADAMTEELFLLHPEWITRYGERGRADPTENACFHIDFLAGAVEADSPEAFADYARWTARMLGARGIEANVLEENFGQMEKHLSHVLLPEERQAVLAFLVRGREACTEQGSQSAIQAETDGLYLTRQVFLDAILAGRRHAALNIVEEALRSGHSHVDIYSDVFSESLHRVGELWEMNKISVAQEHIATSITQYAIASIYPKMTPAACNRGNMVVTGVAGELHQIGGNLIADAMEANGWNVRFLGTNLPHSSVLATIEEISADVLCISTTIVANLPSVAELVRVVRGKLSGRPPRIVLGGAAHRVATKFAWEISSAEAVTDLRRALSLLCA